MTEQVTLSQVKAFSLIVSIYSAVRVRCGIIFSLSLTDSTKFMPWLTKSTLHSDWLSHNIMYYILQTKSYKTILPCSECQCKTVFYKLSIPAGRREGKENPHRLSIPILWDTLEGCE